MTGAPVFTTSPEPDGSGAWEYMIVFPSGVQLSGRWRGSDLGSRVTAPSFELVMRRLLAGVRMWLMACAQLKTEQQITEKLVEALGAEVVTQSLLDPERFLTSLGATS